ncbi:unnamed protein product [Zymoseptoria tritici ST99CH_1A5]|uniref:4Fe-4S ferredoxin-type domain-containing protein n=1 Tax=Zymoseptoria tritici ST99CH_1A5 TaxID=1276529 RepID=A0A1Y6LYC4_ZYMTR|nr:unnamed protein product [Zymoseptoria tritici ST99CH_3D1]SMY29386.1 unnamed protein product [Zymoseptoria tritici ST99CH_1A5]
MRFSTSPLKFLAIVVGLCAIVKGCDMDECEECASGCVDKSTNVRSTAIARTPAEPDRRAGTISSDKDGRLERRRAID